MDVVVGEEEEGMVGGGCWAGNTAGLICRGPQTTAQDTERESIATM